MMLVGEHDKLAGNATSLEDIKHGQSLGNRQAVIELVVDDL